MIKMSKSKNNGIDPQTAVEQYGADTVRLFTMFAAPPEQTLEWNDSGVMGASRFLKRLWSIVHGHIAAGEPGKLSPENLDDKQQALRLKTHDTIAKVSEEFATRQAFNKAVALVMELVNEIGKLADRSTPETLAVEREAIESALLLLNPIVPHISQGLWQVLGNTEAMEASQTWPQVDKSALVKSSIDMVVQINGKVRAKLQVSSEASDDEIIAQAKGDANVLKFIEGKEIKMCKVIKGKLVTFAVK